MAVPIDPKTIAKDCEGDQNCIDRFYQYEGERSESLALGFFIVIICFILLLFASNYRSVFYLKYDILIHRLTAMKPKHTTVIKPISPRRNSQRPVPMK